MQTADTPDRKVFGLYELSNDGTILYSRPRATDGLREAEKKMVGQDFFRDILQCKNNDDLRRHFRRFVTGDRPVDTFVFECMFEQETIRTKVFMTRAYENDAERSGDIVIMDVRRAA